MSVEAERLVSHTGTGGIVRLFRAGPKTLNIADTDTRMELEVLEGLGVRDGVEEIDDDLWFAIVVQSIAWMIRFRLCRRSAVVVRW